MEQKAGLTKKLFGCVIRLILDVTKKVPNIFQIVGVHIFVTPPYGHGNSGVCSGLKEYEGRWNMVIGRMNKPSQSKSCITVRQHNTKSRVFDNIFTVERPLFCLPEISATVRSR